MSFSVPASSSHYNASLNCLGSQQLRIPFGRTRATEARSAELYTRGRGPGEAKTAQHQVASHPCTAASWVRGGSSAHGLYETHEAVLSFAAAQQLSPFPREVQTWLGIHQQNL